MCADSLKRINRISGADAFDGKGFSKRDIYLNEAAIVSDVAAAGSGTELDATDCYAIPGLVDVHFHGSAGADVSDGDEEGLHRMGRYEASRGIVAMCPATMTLSEEQLTQAALVAADYIPKDDESDLVGLNMEGPYISPNKVGAQNPEHVRNPSVDEFKRLQKAAGGLFKIVDIAPEVDGADAFIETLKDDVRISIAHTNSDYETAAHAMDLGAKQLTHMYNAMDPMHHRKPGPIPAAAERAHVTPELITDGVHIHPAMVRLAFRIFGPDRMIMVSDTMRAAGLEDGTYDLGGQDVTVKGPVATIANGALAGSVSDLMRCFHVAATQMDIPLADVVKAASANPAKAIGVDDRFGSLDAGHIASIVLLDKENLALKHVILRGLLLAEDVG